MTAHSSGSQRPSGGGDKRERILAAAERVFAEHGFFAARVAEIARQAGVADGTIYLYFKSKDDLLISLFESRMERVNGDLREAMALESTSEGKLMAFIATYTTMVKENPNVAEVLTIELRQSSKFMKEYANPRFADLLKLVATVIADGQAAGELDDTVPPSIAARMLFGIIDELALAWLLGRGEKFDIVRAADWIGAMTMRGLKPRSDA
ncbi:MAG TPA: TetR/AcrR family transcriptional regulator [Kofleriaceae bacterium]|nr:TetR/AcrR family transcriptional regulator [Kofleriaceae bacterium]